MQFIKAVVIFLTGLATWFGIAFLAVPDGEDFQGVGQMLFMLAVAPAWTVLWIMFWYRVIPSAKDASSSVAPIIGGQLALIALVVFACTIDGRPSYGKTAMKCILAIIPVTLLGVAMGNLTNRIPRQGDGSPK